MKTDLHESPGAPRTPSQPGEYGDRFGPDDDLAAPGWYFNRELTWLSFNFRVLQEAIDPRTPLLERAKFLAIVGSNLDEFFMKRIGGLKQQVAAGVHDRGVDGRTPVEQIEACHVVVRELEARRLAATRTLIEDLGAVGVTLTTFDRLGLADRESLRDYYKQNIYPLLTPQATDPAHPFPFVSNLSLNLLVRLRLSEDDPLSLARVKVPVGGGIPRFLQVGNELVFVPMESVMAHNLDLLFPGMHIEGWSQFRVTRNADTEQDEEAADDLLSMIETELRERQFASVVRLEISQGTPALYRGRLAAELELDEHSDVYEVEGLLGIRDLWELKRHSALAGRSELHDTPHHPVDHPDFLTDRNIFHSIRDAGSILVHHPYESFSTSVERFLREASRDPKVRAIKISLYRTSSHSKVIRCLLDAARHGKQVAVVLELKARFDEAANIRWANRLARAGIHVTYGVVGLKTHCKLVLVVRQDYDGLKRYAHIGTGNYHSVTARSYGDIGLLTSDAAIGRDLTELFNYLTTGYSPKRRYESLLPAPRHLKAGLLEKIEREVNHHSERSPGRIQLKCNAIEDAEICRALYRASQAGVAVDLLVRDTCRLRPGVPGLSETIRVVSIVGRFLEHARVFYFRNGGDEEYFVGSADLMRRNLDSRVEVLAPVESQALRADLRLLLDAQLADRRHGWEMAPDGSYVQRGAGEPDVRGSHEILIETYQQRHHEANRLRRRKIQGIARSEQGGD